MMGLSSKEFRRGVRDLERRLRYLFRCPRKRDFYTCADCGGTFLKEQGDEAAAEERDENGFGDVECELVCDDCYEKIMRRVRQESIEYHDLRMASEFAKCEDLQEFMVMHFHSRIFRWICDNYVNPILEKERKEQNVRKPKRQDGEN